jgi:TonB family protein
MTTAVIEDVKLEPPPPEPKEEEPAPVPEQQPEPSLSAPAATSLLDLPPLPEVAEISAVAANVPVAFAIPVTGVVRQVKQGGQASGAVGGRAPTSAPVSVNAGSQYARFLLLPRLDYPPGALASRLSGTVVIDFKTNATGELYDLHVRTSSGVRELDEAALKNLRRGRWTGESGSFVKNFIFILK